MSATSATPLFALHDIGKDYAAPVLDGVSLTLEAGEVLDAIVAPEHLAISQHDLTRPFR